MSLTRKDGLLFKVRERLAKYTLVILDDFGVRPMNPQAKADLLQILDSRIGMGSTIFVGQRPYNDWHELIDDPLIADAVLDRLSRNRYHIKLKGNSQRRSEAKWICTTR
ncbi:MAG: ATP-binding protein [Rhodobacteraceae bacterium]|nr:ATP-binding protein [Paracoccaceae bacterium]